MSGKFKGEVKCVVECEFCCKNGVCESKQKCSTVPVLAISLTVSIFVLIVAVIVIWRVRRCWKRKKQQKEKEEQLAARRVKYQQHFHQQQRMEQEKDKDPNNHSSVMQELQSSSMEAQEASMKKEDPLENFEEFSSVIFTGPLPHITDTQFPQIADTQLPQSTQLPTNQMIYSRYELTKGL